MNERIWITFVALIVACGDDRPCANTAEIVVLPSPAWQRGPMLAPPDGDRAAAILKRERPQWFHKLDDIDGWPVRPTMVIPIDGAATEVAIDRFVLYGRSDGGVYRQTNTAFTVEIINEGKQIVIVPQTPVPPDVTEVVLALQSGAVTGGEPLPACDGDEGPDPAYDDALEALPSSDAAFALPLRLSKIQRELPALWQQLSHEPVLTVTSVEAKALSDLGRFAPTTTVAATMHPTVAFGAFDLPAYQQPDGRIVLDDDGVFTEAGRTDPGFVVALPASGTPPYPVVLFQHGGGQDKLLFMKYGDALASSGFAIVGIDLPFHGNRESGSGDDFEILDFDDPLRTRDNFRQAVSDHMAVYSGIPALNEAVETTLGVPNALDESRLLFMGLSMGGISGSLTFAATPEIDAAALFVAGGDFSVFLSTGFFSLFFTDVLELPPIESTVMLSLLETMLHGADPIAYGQRVEDRTARPRPALFMQAVGELIVDPRASDVWASAFGTSLADPYDHEVAQMPIVSLPAQDNFTWSSGGPAATRLLLQHPMSEIEPRSRHAGLIEQDYAQQTVAHCFSTFVQSGSCEVIDSGFSSR